MSLHAHGAAQDSATLGEQQGPSVMTGHEGGFDGGERDVMVPEGVQLLTRSGPARPTGIFAVTMKFSMLRS